MSVKIFYVSNGSKTNFGVKLVKNNFRRQMMSKHFRCQMGVNIF